MLCGHMLSHSVIFQHTQEGSLPGIVQTKKHQLARLLPQAYPENKYTQSAVNSITWSIPCTSLTREVERYMWLSTVKDNALDRHALIQLTAWSWINKPTSNTPTKAPKRHAMHVLYIGKYNSWIPVQCTWVPPWNYVIGFMIYSLVQSG